MSSKEATESCDAAPSQPQQWTFTTHVGFFSYDTVPAEPLRAVLPTFGLHAHTSWTTLLTTLATLNRRSASRYKLVYAARHGEGVHNLAEARYGTAAWDAHWSRLATDGTLVWGPDAALTPLGEQQARDVHAVWTVHRRARAAGHDAAPPPPRSSVYVSPLQRSYLTARISYADADADADAERSDPATMPMVVEGFREKYGEHTCDQRRTRREIARDVPRWRFEAGFCDEDPLWKADERETDSHVDERVHAALTDVWNTDSSSVIGITSHSGVMQALFRVAGHCPLNPPTGAFIPLIIKGTPVGV